MDIRDKVAVVTGAASGIGNAVAMEFAKRGLAHVAMVDLKADVEEAAAKINLAAEREVAKGYVGDVGNSVFRKNTFDAINADYGQVHICVPAAGIVRDALAIRLDKTTGKAEMYPEETFRKVAGINYIAPVYWAMELVARIAESRFARGLKKWTPDQEMEGSVVFIGSAAAQGNKGQICYASAKAALDGAASSLMKEAIFHGVRCSTIHPGFTDTPILQALGEDYLKKYVLPDTQLGRLIRPDEIADAVCFMITNQAVSGELWADAGWHPAAA